MAKRYNPFAEKPRMGAPSIYTPELAAEICRRLRVGRSLYSVCEDADMPNRSTVFDWLHDRDDFADQYARAKMQSADADADQAERTREAMADGRLDPNAGRVILDAIKWSAAHKQPKKYGTLRVGGSDGGAIPLRFDSLTDAQLAQFAQRLRTSPDEGSEAEPAGPGGGGDNPPPEGGL
jgi:hypothetical protein